MNGRTLMGVAGVLAFAAFAWRAAAGDSAAAPADTRKNLQDLIRASLTAPPPAPAGRTTESSTELDKAIERLRKIRIPQKTDSTAPAVTPRQETPQPPAPTAKETPKPAPAAAPAPTSVEEMLKQLAQKPADQVHDLLGLADALYQGGRLDEAYTFYEKAHAAKPPLPDPDRAWALFQMANCRRPADPKAAAALYQRVAAEHGSSQWAAISAAQQRLLEWYQANDPQPAASSAKGKTEPRPASGAMTRGN